jgi:nucleotide-binding universal stress UspA family protein
MNLYPAKLIPAKLVRASDLGQVEGSQAQNVLLVPQGNQSYENNLFQSSESPQEDRTQRSETQNPQEIEQTSGQTEEEQHTSGTEGGKESTQANEGETKPEAMKHAQQVGVKKISKLAHQLSPSKLGQAPLIKKIFKQGKGSQTKSDFEQQNEAQMDSVDTMGNETSGLQTGMGSNQTKGTPDMGLKTGLSPQEGELTYSRRIGAKNICVAIDESENSEKAFEWTVRKLATQNDTIQLINVIPQTNFIRDYLVDQLDDAGRVANITSSKEKRLIDKYEAIAQTISQKHARILCSVGVGAPKLSILKAIGRLNAWTLVCGSSSSGFLKGTVFGSVPKYLIEHSKVPVIVTP